MNPVENRYWNFSDPSTREHKVPQKPVGGALSTLRSISEIVTSRVSQASQTRMHQASQRDHWLPLMK